MTSDIEASQNEWRGKRRNWRHGYHVTLTNHILAKKILIHLRFFLNAAQNPADNFGHNFKITVYFNLEKNTQNYEKMHLVDASNIDVFICNFFEKSKKRFSYRWHIGLGWLFRLVPNTILFFVDIFVQKGVKTSVISLIFLKNGSVIVEAVLYIGNGGMKTKIHKFN